MKDSKILVVGTSIPFPIGIAATNRILSYLKLMAEKGIICRVLITKATEIKDQVINNQTSGNFNGISFRYLSNSTVLPGKGKKLIKIKNYIHAQFLLFNELLNYRPDVVITYSYSFSVKLFLILFSGLFRFQVYIEETEYPKILKRNRPNWMKKIYLSQYKYAHGMIVMTKVLQNYYSALGVKKIFHLPMTVDTDRFSGYTESRERHKAFVYAGGSGGFKRDGVENIVQAFLQFYNSHHDYRLFIAGPVDRNDSAFRSIQQLIDKSGAEGSVVFTGNLRTDKIPPLLMQAAGIIMAPEKDFESGGFPTKLGEFLASGTPTICTSVSDISYYIDEDEAFLAKPGDIDELVRQMKFIADHPEESCKIGINGAKKARKVFNAKSYISEMIVFLFNKDKIDE